MPERNPFAINFGIMPIQYIERDLIKDQILMEIKSDIAQNNCFMLTGVRGTGKIVTLTASESQILG